MQGSKENKTSKRLKKKPSRIESKERRRLRLNAKGLNNRPDRKKQSWKE